MRNTVYIKSDEITKLAIVGTLCSQLLVSNGYYLFISYLVALFLFYQLSQPNKPAVFTMIAFNHILQVVAGVWQANYLGKDLNYRSYYTERATILSLIGFLFMFAPIIYEQSKLKKISLAAFKAQADRLSTQKSLNCYVIALVISSILAGLAFLYPGLTQIIFSVIKIKWFFFLLFGYQAVLKKERLPVFYLLVGFEFISGFYSFFSEFKTVIYYLGVLLVGFIATINFRQLLIVAVLATGVAYLGVLWTSVKTEYRSFLNKGTTDQVAAVSKDEAMNKLLSLSEEANEKEAGGAQTALLDRLQYTYHFAKTIERVPEVIPYQNGDNWLSNIEFATTPRFLNPDKPTIDNSVKATKYTGIRYATAKQGVSFSLGYYAEFYIDFGPYLMMIALLGLGLFYSRVYRFFLTKPSDNPVFNYSIVGALFFEFSNFEMDGTFLAGRLFASLVTFFALNFFFSRKLLNYLLLPVSSIENANR